MDEKKFLEKFAKSLGVENVLEEMNLKKAKEEKMMKSLAKGLGVETVLEEINQKSVKETALLENLNRTLLRLTEPELKQVEEVFVEPVALFEEPVVEQELITEIGRQPEPELPKTDIVTKSVLALSKPNQQDNSIQAVADKLPPGIQKELDIIRKSIADFHRFAQRHSQMGGGGAGDIVHLDHQTKTVYSNYVYTNKDYYIGAGITPLTITLPTIAKNGRVIAIKDEVGNCSQYPITVQGMVDNDAGGFILAENNGGVQMIYNNGSWRII
jgi:hypothetical protein